MPFKRPALKEIDDRIRNDIIGAVRIKDTKRSAPILRRSVIGVKSRAYAGACHSQYGYLEWLAKQRFAHSAEGEFLDAEGMMYGMPRKTEASARGKITITGLEGAAVLVETVFQNSDGGQYKVTVPSAIAEGQAVLSVEAVTPGRAGNLPADAVLTLTHPVEGINSKATVGVDGLYGGTDVEPDELYRERILERKRKPPHGGAAHDYVAWAKEVKGVTRAWCLPMWMGEGTVGVMFLCDGDTDPFPNDEQCREVWEHIEKVRPVTVSEHYAISPVRQEIDIIVKLSPDTEAIREAVTEEFDDFLFRDGAPDTYIHVSRLSEAISTATGEHHHYLIDPINDIHVPKNAIPVRGRIAFIDNLEG